MKDIGLQILHLQINLIVLFAKDQLCPQFLHAKEDSQVIFLRYLEIELLDVGHQLQKDLVFVVGCRTLTLDFLLE